MFLEKAKTNLKNKLKNEKGVTIVALVITILVLLILAGITIGIAFRNDNGIIRRTDESKFKQEMSEVKRAVNEKIISGETIKLGSVGTQEIINNALKDIDLDDDLKEILKQRLYIQDEELVIDNSSTKSDLGVDKLTDDEEKYLADIGISDKASILGDSFELTFNPKDENDNDIDKDSGRIPDKILVEIEPNEDKLEANDKIMYVFSNEIGSIQEARNLLPNEWLEYNQNEKPMVEHETKVFAKVVNQNSKTISNIFTFDKEKYYGGTTDPGGNPTPTPTQTPGGDIDPTPAPGGDTDTDPTPDPLPVDSKGPQIEFVEYPYNSWTKGQSIKARVTDDTGIEKVEYVWLEDKQEPNNDTKWTTDADVNNDKKYEHTYNLLDETGRYRLWVRATDLNGKVTGGKPYYIRSDVVLIDNTAPTVPVIESMKIIDDSGKEIGDYKSDTWTNQNVKITLRSTDNHAGILKYQYKNRRGNAGWVDIDTDNSVGTLIFNKEMSKDIRFRAVDAAKEGSAEGKGDGNISEETEQITVKIDKTAPNISLDPNTGKFVVGTGKSKAAVQTAKPDVSDPKVDPSGDNQIGSGVNPSSLKYAWSTSGTQEPTNDWKSYTSGASIKGDEFPVGVYYIWLKASDNAGNPKTYVSGKYEVISSDGTLQISHAPTEWTNQDVTITVKYNDVFTKGKLVGYGLDADLAYKDRKTNTIADNLSTYTRKVGTNGYVYAEAKDSASNTVKKTDYHITNVDKLLPTVSGLKVEDVVKYKKVKIVGTISDHDATSEYGMSGISAYMFTQSSTKPEVNASGWKDVTTKGSKSVECKSDEITETGIWYLWTKDQAGNINDADGSNKFEITDKMIDKLKPENLTIDAHLDNEKGDKYDSNWTNHNVWVKLTATDNVGINRYEWAVADDWSVSNLTTKDNIGTILFDANRNNTIKFRAIDPAGNISDVKTLVVKIDKNASTVSLKLVEVEKYKKVKISGTVTEKPDKDYSGIAAYMFNQTATKPASNDSNWKDAGDAKGKQTGTFESAEITDVGTWYFWTKDIAGNINDADESNKFEITDTIIDKIVPTNLTVEARLNDSKGDNYNQQWTNQSVWVKLTAQDNVGIAGYEWTDNTTWVSTDITTTSGVGEITFKVNRDNTVKFRAFDPAGNRSTEQTLTVKIDKNASEVKLEIENVEIYKKVKIKATVTEKPDSGYSGIAAYMFTKTETKPNASDSNWNDAGNLKGKQTGTFSSDVITENGTWYFWTKDIAGNVNNGDNSNKINIDSSIIDKEKPTNLKVEAHLNNAQGETYNQQWTNQDVWVKLTAQDNVKVDHYEWTVDNNWSASGITTTSEVGTITFNTNRNNTVKFRAVDPAGNTSEEETLFIKIDKDVPTVTTELVVVEQYKRVKIAGTVTEKPDTDYSGIAAYMFTNKQDKPQVNDNGWIDAESSKGQKTGTFNSSEITENGTWYFWTKDVAGNINDDTNNKIVIDDKIIDNVDPSNLKVEAHLNNAQGETYNQQWTNQDVWVKLTAIDNVKVDHYEWTVDNNWSASGITTTSEVGTITFNANRNNTVKFRAVDPAGNTSEEETLLIKIDKDVPTVTTELVVVEQYKRVKIAGTVTEKPDSGYSGIAAYMFTNKQDKPQVNDNGWIDAESSKGQKTGTFNSNDITDVGTWYFWTKDVAGNINDGNNKIVIDSSIIDKEKPTNLNVEAHLNDEHGVSYDQQWTNQNVWVKLTAKDNVGISKYEWTDNTTWSSKDITTTAQVGNITYSSDRKSTIKFRAVDLAGNTSDESDIKSLVVMIDKVNPVVTNVKVTAQAGTNKIKIAAIANDQYPSGSSICSGIKYYAVTESNTTPTNSEWQTIPTTVQSNNTPITINVDKERKILKYYFWVKDQAGNVSSSKEFISDVVPPTVNFNANGGNALMTSSGTAKISSTITVTDDFSGVDTNTLKYAWVGPFDSEQTNITNNDWTNFSSTTFTVSKSNCSKGYYYLLVRASDKNGNELNFAKSKAFRVRDDGNVSITLSNENNGVEQWTNTDVTATIIYANLDDNSLKKNVVSTGTEGTNYRDLSQNSVTVMTKNVTIKVTVTDIFGNSISTSKKVTKIDKIQPTGSFSVNGGRPLLDTERGSATVRTRVYYSDENDGSGINGDAKYIWWEDEPNTEDSAFMNKLKTSNNTISNGGEIEKDDCDTDTRYYLCVFFKDNAGNETVLISDYFCIYEDTDGLIKISINPQNWTNKVVVATVEWNDTIGFVNQMAGLANTEEAAKSNARNGEYIVNDDDYLDIDVENNNMWVAGMGEDAFGNVVWKTREITNIDKDKPYIDISPNSIDDHYVCPKDPSIEPVVTAAEMDIYGSGVPDDIYYYKWIKKGNSEPTIDEMKKSDTGRSGESVNSPPSETGIWILYVYTYDRAGNENFTHSGEYWQDCTGPIITVTGTYDSTQEAYIGETRISITDAEIGVNTNGVIKLKNILNNTTKTLNNNTLLDINYVDGEYEITAQDKGGNTSTKKIKLGSSREIPISNMQQLSYVGDKSHREMIDRIRCTFYNEIEYTYYLTNDITVDNTWTSINRDFCANFDGKNYSIKGIKITKDTLNRYDAIGGIFKSIRGDSHISNLILSAPEIHISTISDEAYIGLLAGAYYGGTIDNIKVENGFVGISDALGYSMGAKETYVGGILGGNPDYDVDEITISNCSFSGNLTLDYDLSGMGEFSCAGGIVGGTGSGNCSQIHITKSYNYGNIENFGISGGIVGKTDTDDDTYRINISECYNMGIVGGNENVKTGGIIGEANNTIISNCFNAGNISSDGTYIGGIAGYVRKYNLSNIITKCYNAGNFSKSVDSNVASIGNFESTDISTKIADCYVYYTKGITNQNDSNKSYTSAIKFMNFTEAHTASTYSKLPLTNSTIWAGPRNIDSTSAYMPYLKFHNEDVKIYSTYDDFKINISSPSKNYVKKGDIVTFIVTTSTGIKKEDLVVSRVNGQSTMVSNIVVSANNENASSKLATSFTVTVTIGTGNGTFNIKAVSNNKEATSVAVTVDNTPPVITISNMRKVEGSTEKSIPSGTWTKPGDIIKFDVKVNEAVSSQNLIRMSYVESDYDGTDFSILNIEEKSNTFYVATMEVPDSDQNPFFYHIPSRVVKDLAGNLNNDTESTERWKIDNVKPTIEVSFINNSSNKITATAKDLQSGLKGFGVYKGEWSGSSYDQFIKDADNVDGTYVEVDGDQEDSLNRTIDGSGYYTFGAQDQVGNYTIMPKYITVISLTNPEVNIYTGNGTTYSPYNATATSKIWTNKDVYFRLSDMKNPSGCTYQYRIRTTDSEEWSSDESGWENVSKNTYIKFADKSGPPIVYDMQFRVISSDSSQKTSPYQKNVYVYIDKDAPSVEFGYTGDTFSGNNFTTDVIIKDDLSGLKNQTFYYSYQPTNDESNNIPTKWYTLNSNRKITIGELLSGDYTIWIKEGISDNVGNKTPYIKKRINFENYLDMKLISNPDNIYSEDRNHIQFMLKVKKPTVADYQGEGTRDIYYNYNPGNTVRERKGVLYNSVGTEIWRPGADNPKVNYNFESYTESFKDIWEYWGEVTDSYEIENNIIKVQQYNNRNYPQIGKTHRYFEAYADPEGKTKLTEKQVSISIRYAYQRIYIINDEDPENNYDADRLHYYKDNYIIDVESINGYSGDVYIKVCENAFTSEEGYKSKSVMSQGVYLNGNQGIPIVKISSMTDEKVDISNGGKFTVKYRIELDSERSNKTKSDLDINDIEFEGTQALISAIGNKKVEYVNEDVYWLTFDIDYPMPGNINPVVKAGVITKTGNSNLRTRGPETKFEGTLSIGGVVIPNGYYLVGGTPSTGLVISDDVRDAYAWVQAHGWTTTRTSSTTIDCIAQQSIGGTTKYLNSYKNVTSNFMDDYNGFTPSSYLQGNQFVWVPAEFPTEVQTAIQNYKNSHGGATPEITINSPVDSGVSYHIGNDDTTVKIKFWPTSAAKDNGSFNTNLLGKYTTYGRYMKESDDYVLRGEVDKKDPDLANYWYHKGDIYGNNTHYSDKISAEKVNSLLFYKGYYVGRYNVKAEQANAAHPSYSNEKYAKDVFINAKGEDYTTNLAWDSGGNRRLLSTVKYHISQINKSSSVNIEIIGGADWENMIYWICDSDEKLLINELKNTATGFRNNIFGLKGSNALTSEESHSPEYYLARNGKTFGSGGKTYDLNQETLRTVMYIK